MYQGYCPELPRAWVRDDVGGDDGDRMNIIRETRRPTQISNDSHYQFDDTT